MGSNVYGELDFSEGSEIGLSLGMLAGVIVFIIIVGIVITGADEKLKCPTCHQPGIKYLTTTHYTDGSKEEQYVCKKCGALATRKRAARKN